MLADEAAACPDITPPRLPHPTRTGTLPCSVHAAASKRAAARVPWQAGWPRQLLHCPVTFIVTNAEAEPSEPGGVQWAESLVPTLHIVSPLQCALHASPRALSFPGSVSGNTPTRTTAVTLQPLKSICRRLEQTPMRHTSVSGEPKLKV